MASSAAKAILIAAGVAGAGTLASAAWLGASAYVGQAANAELRAFAAQPSRGSGVRIANLRHEAGLLRADGGFDVRIEDDCDPSAAGREIATLQVQYRMDHRILPGSLARIEWTLKPAGKAGAALARAFGGAAKLEGSGRVTFGRELVSSLSTPELSHREGGMTVQVAPTRGRVSVGRTSFGLDWKTDRVVVRGGGQALELRGVALEMDLRNRTRGIGTTAFSIDGIAASGGSAQGLRLAAEVGERDDRLHMKLAPTLRNLEVAGQQARDLALEIAVRDLHATSIEVIGRIAGESCGLQNLTDEELAQLRSAARVLLANGLTLELSKLSGAVGSGSLQGRAQVSLAKAASPDAKAVDLASRLRASGEFAVKGDAMTADQRQLAIALGAVAETPEGLKASFEYADGLLKANNRVLDAAMVEGALAQADQAILAFLDSGATRTARAAPPRPAESAAPSAAPPAAPAEAAAPALPASPADHACDTLAACVHVTLKAAAREDVEAMRASAARIEALPKPEPGNRAVSRKLNAEGLEALKRNDAAAAVDLFRRGVLENPRDVEIAANHGYALVRAGRAAEAATVLSNALLLDPRRTSTWTPLGEAYALSGRPDEALAAMWVGWQWVTNREKALAFYADRADKERDARPALANLYRQMAIWAGEGTRPPLASLGGRQ